MGKLYAQRQRVQDTLEEKFGLIECEGMSVEEKYKGMCVKYYQWFGKESREESKQTLDYAGND